MFELSAVCILAIFTMFFPLYFHKARFHILINFNFINSHFFIYFFGFYLNLKQSQKKFAQCEEEKKIILAKVL